MANELSTSSDSPDLVDRTFEDLQGFLETSTQTDKIPEAVDLLLEELRFQHTSPEFVLKCRRIVLLANESELDEMSRKAMHLFSDRLFQLSESPLNALASGRIDTLLNPPNHFMKHLSPKERFEGWALHVLKRDLKADTLETYLETFEQLVDTLPKKSDAFNRFRQIVHREFKDPVRFFKMAISLKEIDILAHFRKRHLELSPHEKADILSQWAAKRPLDLCSACEKLLSDKLITVPEAADFLLAASKKKPSEALLSLSALARHPEFHPAGLLPIVERLIQFISPKEVLKLFKIRDWEMLHRIFSVMDPRHSIEFVETLIEENLEYHPAAVEILSLAGSNHPTALSQLYEPLHKAFPQIAQNRQLQDLFQLGSMIEELDIELLQDLMIQQSKELSRKEIELWSKLQMEFHPEARCAAYAVFLMTRKEYPEVIHLLAKMLDIDRFPVRDFFRDAFKKNQFYRFISRFVQSGMLRRRIPTDCLPSCLNQVFPRPLFEMPDKKERMKCAVQRLRTFDAALCFAEPPSSLFMGFAFPLITFE